ncbi:MAG: phosphoribosylaminoimidazolesuccinocarboxamide synthase [Caldilineaceae bacterium]|nr:phosphoribosylaminoimidazolesuccinocarboxamide synthase [Caldilineaceae bacterium]
METNTVRREYHAGNSAGLPPVESLRKFPPEFTHALRSALSQTLDETDFDFLGPKTRGKVRDIYARGDQLVLITTDRLSAFDRILGQVPYKGQVLNQLAAFWFEQTADIVANHLLAVPDPNVTVARRCRPLPVEVVVRGYISGVTKTALWYRYSRGERTIYGMDFPDGLEKNDPLPQPVITPTTKGGPDGHDERITGADVVSRGLIPSERWDEVQDVALSVFARGQEIARRAGLILVDTKYEFGIDDQEQLVLIDEVHTPDSSRFWIADSYVERKAAGREPENFDKEFVRLYYAAQGYRGDSEPFPLPDDLAVQAAQRYIRTYELLTGRVFEPGALPASPRIEHNLRAWLAANG